MNVLVLAPHPDDEAIGCGGAVLTHLQQGDRVGVVFLTSGELGLKHLPAEQAIASREAEAAAAAEILGHEIVAFLRLADYALAEQVATGAERLAPILSQWQPRQIYLPHPLEEHPDHAAVIDLLRPALRRAGLHEVWLLGYEVWTPIPRHDHVIDITTVWPTKAAALRAYPSQLASFGYERATEGLNQYRGALVGHCEFAEVFTTLDVE